MSELASNYVPSYVHGATDEPLLGQTIAQALDRVTAWVDHPALVSRAQGIR